MQRAAAARSALVSLRAGPLAAPPARIASPAPLQQHHQASPLPAAAGGAPTAHRQHTRGWLSWLRRGSGRHGAPGEPPVYPREPRRFRVGPQESVLDDYWWLADYGRAAPYLQREQEYYEQASRGWSREAAQLLQEMRRHAAATHRDDPPERLGPWWYWGVSDPAGGQETVLRRCVQTGREQVLLSADGLREDAQQIERLLGGGVRVRGGQVAALKLSRDGRLLAFGLEVDGGPEQLCCAVKDIQSGLLLPRGVLPNASSFEFTADGGALVYCEADSTGRPSKVYRRELADAAAAAAAAAAGGRGPAAPADALLFAEGDPRHFVSLTRTKDWAFLLVNSHSKLSSEVHLVDAADPLARPACVQRRRPGLEYFVEHHHSGNLLVLTNGGGGGAEGSGEYRLATVAASEVAAGQGGEAAWRTLLPEPSPGSAVEDLDAVGSGAVLRVTRDGRPELLLVRLAEAGEQPGALRVEQQLKVALPEWALALRPGINEDYGSPTMRLYASSPAVPEVPLELDLRSGQLRPHAAAQHQQGEQPRRRQRQLRQQLSSGDEAGAPPVCERLWAPAADGVRVPLTLLRPAELQRDGAAPLLVEVYGAYGHALAADFRSHRMPLVERGWSVALAHVRGGGELGRRWHAAGRQLLKPNSVSDLLACLDLLADLGITRPGRVAGHAASAGGLTLAAAVNARPDWFGAVVLEAPLVDLAGAVGEAGRGHVLAQHEADEWGDPERQPGAAAVALSLCPYTNAAMGGGGGGGGDGGRTNAHPATLVTAGLQDTRVPYWMPAKYVAKLRGGGGQPAPLGDGPLVLLHFDEGAGHFDLGQSGGGLADVAAQYAFLLHHLGGQAQASQRGAQPPRLAGG